MKQPEIIVPDKKKESVQEEEEKKEEDFKNTDPDEQMKGFLTKQKINLEQGK